MRGLVVPDAEEDFTADQVELYFDLAFVFAFSRLVSFIHHDHSAEGVARAGLLFLLLWWPWAQFSWSANAVSSSARVVRLLFLVATVASVPMAASVEAAFGDGGPAFAISLSVIVAMAIFTMASGVETGSTVWRSIMSYSVPNYLGMAIVIAGSFLDDTPRVVCWCVGVAIVIVGTIRAGGSEWLIRSGHFAERHGLIVIVALGEVIVALGVPVVRGLDTGQGLPARTITALVAAGALGGLLWWSYFDRPAPALEHRAEAQPDGRLRGRFARDVYTYAHAPLVAGVILAAAALEEITLHPADPLARSFRWMLWLGLAFVLVGVVAAIGRAFGVVAWERLVAGGVLAAVIAVCGAADASGLVLLVAVDAVLLVMLVIEHLRIEPPPALADA